jgi:phosphopantetheinyl transferase
MKKDDPICLIENYTSKLIVWKDETYFKKIEKGFKKKEIERETIKKMLASIDKELILEHKSNGAPSILHSTYSNISISHSGSYFAIYLSNTPVGVDIQIFKDSLVKGLSYFVNQKEESTIHLSENNLHLIWAAKEAFYKKNSGEIEDLKNDVTIQKIDELSKMITLKYQGGNFILNYSIFEKYLVAWT